MGALLRLPHNTCEDMGHTHHNEVAKDGDTIPHVTFRARDTKDRLDEDHIEPAGDGWTAPKCQADGSDADRIEAWLERRILGTQLGPNRNGATC